MNQTKPEPCNHKNQDPQFPKCLHCLSCGYEKCSDDKDFNLRPDTENWEEKNMPKSLKETLKFIEKKGFYETAEDIEKLFKKAITQAKQDTLAEVREVVEKSSGYGDSGYCGRCNFLISELTKL